VVLSLRRCRTRGTDCHNALTCFKCGRLGHVSSFCRSITLLPSSSSPSNLFSSSSHISRSSSTIPLSHNSFHSTMSSRGRVLRFLENDLSIKTEEELSTGVILEARGVTQADLLAALKVYFPCGGHQ
jgi:Zinc knuckle